MSKNATTSTSQFVWGKYIIILACAIVAAGMVYLVYWSFGETWDWFRYMDVGSIGYVSLGFAAIFQGGQNVATFFWGKYRVRSKELQRKIAGYKNVPDPSLGDAYIRYMELVDEKNSAITAMWFWAFGFLVAGLVDGLTNVVQMNLNLDNRRLQGLAVEQSKYALNFVFGGALVFFEEGVGVVISALGHTVNDVREIHGNKRLAWLDLFSKGATDVLSGGLGGATDNSGIGHSAVRVVASSKRGIGEPTYRRQTP